MRNWKWVLHVSWLLVGGTIAYGVVTGSAPTPDMDGCQSGSMVLCHPTMVVGKLFDGLVYAAFAFGLGLIIMAVLFGVESVQRVVLPYADELETCADKFRHEKLTHVDAEAAKAFALHCFGRVLAITLLIALLVSKV